MDLSALVAALENLILERTSDGHFVRCCDIPTWCHALASRELPTTTPFVLEDVFPFLGAFVERAEDAWRGLVGAPVSSDLWTEVGARGEEIHLQASALRAQGADVMVIARNDRLFEQQQLVLQRARELRLAHDAFMREIEQKDILIHAIVHDLAAPLHGILGALSLLGEQSLGEPSGQWVRVSLQAAMRQRELIGEILDSFSSEHGALSWEAGSTLPDANTVVERVASELAPAAERQEVRLETRVDVAPCVVAAEETRLFRVLGNLVDNALRYSPRGGLITIATRHESHAVCVSVEDEGPGVPSTFMPRLFEKFARGAAGGSSGLGLYFCRITVERWGGQIGYEPRNEGGSRFWLRLPTADGRPLNG
jgi:signal transduction histidine kinase